MYGSLLHMYVQLCILQGARGSTCVEKLQVELAVGCCMSIVNVSDLGFCGVQDLVRMTKDTGRRKIVVCECTSLVC